LASATSVDDMLAELSTRKMNRSPSSLVPSQPGRNSANIARAISRSCKNMSRFCRSRCHRLLTCKSSIDRFHRYVLGTSSGRRLSFKKYSATIAGGTSASTAHCQGESVLRNKSNIVESRAESRESRARRES
jgi:hypothetical protein